MSASHHVARGGGEGEACQAPVLVFCYTPFGAGDRRPSGRLGSVAAEAASPHRSFSPWSIRGKLTTVLLMQ